MHVDRGTMSCHLLTLLILLVGAVSAQSEVHHYITPSPDIPCPSDPCLTLSQFADNSNNYTRYISLIFLPGNHSLNGELILSGVVNFSMEPHNNETVMIECPSQSERFIVNETTFVAIKGLHFIGCGGNTVTSVEKFNIENTIFQGVAGEGRGTALVLREVNFIKITDCSFISNTPGVNSERHYAREFIKNSSILRELGLEEDDLISVGGALLITSSSVSVNNAKFVFNEAEIGGVMLAYKSIITVIQCTYSYNRALHGGVMATIDGSFNISSSTFMNNSATLAGGVMVTSDGLFHITNSSFTNNHAVERGGVMATAYGSFTITYSIFTSNKANVGGVIISEHVRLFNINYSSFNNNTADRHGGIMFTLQCSTQITGSTFHYNLGSLYTSNGNLTFSGQSKFVNCVEPSMKTLLAHQEGGALTSFQSTVTFNGETSFLNNQARQGGAILAIESTIMLYGATTIANNTATDNSGGGASLQQSDLEVKGSCNVFDNYAMRGAGVHAKSSIIRVYQREGTLQFTNNRAENGSGLYLEANPKLYILKDFGSGRNSLIFTGNHANYGGAVYVADDTNPGACSPNTECFIQTLALYQSLSSVINTVNIQFSGNTVTERGSNLFGGLLDRCVPGSFAEVYLLQPSLRTQYYNGVNYLQDLSNIAMDYSIASQPVRVCFCDSFSKPNCSYQPPIIRVRKGETFKVSLVAVDQFNHSIESNLFSSLALDSAFSEGQQTQSVGRNCTDLTFNVFSLSDYASISLFADGPCGSSQLSIRNLDIQFSNCTCPVGFQPTNSESRCECVCDSELSPYITKCNFTTSSIIRENTNSWITYINDTDPPAVSGYVIHPNCLFDYCQPRTDNVSINLNLPNGADAQCAFNRTGTLCGACLQHLSLSLGSSRCLPCPTHWPAVYIVILLAAIIGGILLVVALLFLNMTVAGGLINGIIFYANIVSANSAIFFPSSESSFPTVFVAWLNLDLGIDVCFFDGLDTYTKTWLQLVFPVYIISLGVIIIIVSEYSPRFAALIGRKDPIATLATLILLSYAKLLSIAITALSFTDISYPDGSQGTVWLLDGNVKYFEGKHAVLVVVALLIILVGVPYTILLLLWQWIVRAPRWKVFKWTRNTKLNALIAAYHVPYNSKYRYWTGLLLLVRVILYITASVTVSGDPEVSLLSSIILVGGLLFHNRCIRNIMVHKESMTDIVETVVYFNLLALAVFSLYKFKTDPTKQAVVAYISTIITFLLLTVVIGYHVYLLIRKEKTTVEHNAHPQAPVQPATAQETHSVAEFHMPQCTPPEDDRDEVADIQVKEIVRDDSDELADILREDFNMDPIYYNKMS